MNLSDIQLLGKLLQPQDEDHKKVKTLKKEAIPKFLKEIYSVENLSGRGVHVSFQSFDGKTIDLVPIDELLPRLKNQLFVYSGGIHPPNEFVTDLIESIRAFGLRGKNEIVPFIRSKYDTKYECLYYKESLEGVSQFFKTEVSDESKRIAPSMVQSICLPSPSQLNITLESDPAIRRKYMLELPERLKKYIRVKDERAIWVIISVLAATLHSGIATPGIVFIGEPGCGKTQMVKTLRDFVNPSNIKISTFGGVEESLREIGNNFIIAFDNMSVINNSDVSNYLCQCLTRASITSRWKYSTNDDFIQHFACSILMTGLEPVSINFQDLSDRIINIEVPYLSGKERGFNTLLDDERDEERAIILSGLIQLVLEATPKMKKDLEDYQLLKRGNQSEHSSSEGSFLQRIQSHSRFADWDLFSWHCCEILVPNGGSQFRDFLDSYIPTERENFLLRNPLYQVITEWVSTRYEERPFRVTELFAIFENIRQKLHLSKTNSFPGSSAWLPRRMLGIERHLTAKGIGFKNFHVKDQSFIEFFKIADDDNDEGEALPDVTASGDNGMSPVIELTDEVAISTQKEKTTEEEVKNNENV